MFSIILTTILAVGRILLALSNYRTMSSDQRRQRMTSFNPLLGFLILLNLSNTLSHCCCSCCVSFGEDRGGASITGAFRPSLRQLPPVKRADTARESQSRQERHQTPSSGNIPRRIRRGGTNCEALSHNRVVCTIVQGFGWHALQYVMSEWG